MVDEHIARAIADIACFLEFTDKSLLDEDVSVAAMEQLGCELGQATEQSKSELAKALNAVAPSYGDRALFISSLLENLGV